MLTKACRSRLGGHLDGVIVETGNHVGARARFSARDPPGKLVSRRRVPAAVISQPDRQRHRQVRTICACPPIARRTGGACGLRAGVVIIHETTMSRARVFILQEGRPIVSGANHVLPRPPDKWMRATWPRRETGWHNRRL